MLKADAILKVYKLSLMIINLIKKSFNKFVLVVNKNTLIGLVSFMNTKYIKIDKKNIPACMAIGIFFKVLLNPSINGLSDGLVIAASITNLLATTTITERYKNESWKFGFVYNFFFFLTLIYVKVSSLLYFFIVYEMFLLPSAFLIFIFNPGKRGLETCKHFLLWTQTGSVFVGISFLYIASYCGMTSFNSHSVFIKKIPIYIQFLLIIGFLIKVPSYPFYFWLLKTHVESVTSFSIFLSGFLVKVAVYGIFKVLPLLDSFVRSSAICLLFSGGIASSAAIIKQTDYKKLVAYTTVQEMSQLAIMVFLFGNSNSAIVGHFVIVHGLLSAIFFFISEVLQRIYKSRCVFSISGLMIVAPKLSMIVVAAILLFRGFPFTSKNKIEMNMVDLLYNYEYLLLALWLVFIVFLGNIAITFVTFKTLVFSAGKEKNNDVTYFEFIYAVFVCLLLIFFIFIKIN